MGRPHTTIGAERFGSAPSFEEDSGMLGEKGTKPCSYAARADANGRLLVLYARNGVKPKQGKLPNKKGRTLSGCGLSYINPGGVLLSHGETPHYHRR
jgi:hypothetical protein